MDDWTVVHYGKRHKQIATRSHNFLGPGNSFQSHRRPADSGWTAGLLGPWGGPRGPRAPQRAATGSLEIPYKPFPVKKQWWTHQGRPWRAGGPPRPSPPRHTTRPLYTPADPQFRALIKTSYDLIRMIHHLEQISPKGDQIDPPPTIQRVTSYIMGIIKPANPNPNTMQLLEGNARNWQYTTILALERHYREGIANILKELKPKLNKNWIQPFEVAKRWARNRFGRRIRGDTLDHAQALIVGLGEPEVGGGQPGGETAIVVGGRHGVAPEGGSHHRAESVTQTSPGGHSPIGVDLNLGSEEEFPPLPSSPRILLGQAMAPKEQRGQRANRVEKTPRFNPCVVQEADPILNVEAASQEKPTTTKQPREPITAPPHRPVLVHEPSSSTTSVDKPWIEGEDEWILDQEPTDSNQTLAMEGPSNLLQDPMTVSPHHLVLIHDSSPVMTPEPVQKSQQMDEPQPLETPNTIHYPLFKTPIKPTQPTQEITTPDTHSTPVEQTSSSRPTRHINTKRKMMDWNLIIKKKCLIMGDSNLSRIPDFEMPDVQIDSYPGATFRHAEAILDRVSLNRDVTTLILAFGLNNRDQKIKQTAIKQIQRAVKMAKTRFPEAKIWIPLINFSRRLTLEEQVTLTELNRYIRTHTNAIPKLPRELFQTVYDNLHWTPQTAGAMLTHWAKFLNC